MNNLKYFFIFICIGLGISALIYFISGGNVLFLMGGIPLFLGGAWGFKGQGER